METPPRFNVEKLPPEMILQVCQQMPTIELFKFVRSNKRIRDICQKELQDREPKKYNVGYGDFFNDIFNEIKKREEINDEYWSPDGDFEIEKTYYPEIRRLYFRGNLYHAFLNLQRYLFTKSQRIKINLLNNMITDEEEIETLTPKEMVDSIFTKIVNENEDFYLQRNKGPIVIS